MATTYYQREPVGAGFSPAGESNTPDEFNRGAGDPITEHTAETGNATTYTEDNDE